MCNCLCHESAENPPGYGVPIHIDKCRCNGGTGWTDI